MALKVTEVKIDVRHPGKPRIMVTIRRPDGKIFALSIGDIGKSKPSEMVAEALKDAEIEEAKNAAVVG